MSSAVIICMQRICAFMKAEIPKDLFALQAVVCVMERLGIRQQGFSVCF